jgi:hypothetical protein
MSKERNILRRECIEEFEYTCQYCERKGDALKGPDGRAWHLDRRWPGMMGGDYAPNNVTLSCGFCNCQKCDRPPTDDPRWDSAMDLLALQHCRREGRHYEAWLDSEPGRREKYTERGWL